MKQLLILVSFQYPNHVCFLHISIYGLCQATRVCSNELKDFVVSYEFKQAFSNNILFKYCKMSALMFVMVYVDDSVVTISSSWHIKSMVKLLGNQISIEYLYQSCLFLDIDVIPRNNCLILI